MRGLKQMFPCLYLFGNNKFIDGKKVEIAHLWGKLWQTRHNNFKSPFKEMVTKHACRMLSLIYIFNGGKWGEQLQYCIGPNITNLKDPDKPGNPHPILNKVLIPEPPLHIPKIEVKRLYKPNYLKNSDIIQIFHDKYKNELNHLLQMKFGNDIQCTIDDVCHNDDWCIRQIASFIFHQGTSSFHMNFDKLCHGKKNICVVKLKQGFVMKFTQAFVIQYQNNTTALLCKGTIYPICTAQHPDQWLDDYYSSMHYININSKNAGWSFMSNIAEPIFLIHNCVSFGQVKDQLPQIFRHINKYDFVQNFISWSNRMHRWKQSALPQSNNIKLPCGPRYVCKQHQSNACTQCINLHNAYNQQQWNLQWCCNTQYSPHFYIFDSKNGLVMTMMKTCHTSVK